MTKKMRGLELGEEKKGESLRQKLNLIEAALYISGRPLDVKTLRSILRIRSDDKVRKLARMLVEEYADRDRALELLELNDGRFVLQLKPKFVEKVKRLTVRPLLTSGPLKTLAYIAYRQPIVQSQVIAVRGSHAYRHIHELEERGLIVREKLGKTRILRTTGIFADYFNLSHDLRVMKNQLKAMFEAFGKTMKQEKK